MKQPNQPDKDGWIKFNTVISHPALVHGFKYEARLETGQEITALFSVYDDGEVAFVLPDSRQELRVTHFKI